MKKIAGELGRAFLDDGRYCGTGRKEAVVDALKTTNTLLKLIAVALLLLLLK